MTHSKEKQDNLKDKITKTKQYRDNKGENFCKQIKMTGMPHLYVMSKYMSHLYVMSGWRGINSAGPNSMEQPRVISVSSSPWQVSKTREPRFNIQARKRLS